MNSVRKELQIFPGPRAWEHSREPQLVPEGQGEPHEGLARKFLVPHEDRSAQVALSQLGASAGRRRGSAGLGCRLCRLEWAQPSEPQSPPLDSRSGSAAFREGERLGCGFWGSSPALGMCTHCRSAMGLQTEAEVDRLVRLGTFVS